MKKEPLVMCLTNIVAAEFTADALLAIGAKPAMVSDPADAAELSAVADSILINLGTVHARQVEAIRLAIKGARPWVLDPVGCQFLSGRARLARELIALGPTVIRGNHAEIRFILDSAPDSTVLSTGEVDEIFDAHEHVEVSGGVAMLERVTATGCVQGAVVAAMLGRGMRPLAAALAASRLMKRAGERAWERAKTPGAFRTALVDALYELDGKGGVA